MRRDVVYHVRTCEACQKWEVASRKAGKKYPTQPVEPFDLIFLDWIVKLPVTPRGNVCILTCTDAMTKWTEAIAAPAATSEAGEQFLRGFFTRYGVPLAVATDNGGHFEGRFHALLEKLGVQHHHGSPYHPQTTGQAEKTNGLIVSRIRRWREAGIPDWDAYLDVAVLAVNSRRSERLKFSPMEALMGRRPKIPMEVKAFRMKAGDLAERFSKVDEEEDVERHLRLLGPLRDEFAALCREKAVRWANMDSQRSGGPKFQVGDRVYIRADLGKKKLRKFTAPWRGPGVIEWLGDHGAAVVFEVTPIGSKRRRININDLKAYRP
ncbi:MAG: DDE-type integrase/transposase/recombinase, partial [Pseudomonadales bacterium]|nr:DDE-type integrase/transposase/recombinase [Pseudomonadales bacterium]